jgi:hypothetical protein
MITMGSAWHEVSHVRRPAARWAGLAAAVLIAACGGEREEAPAAGTGAVASADSVAAPAPAPTSTPDTAGAAAGGDTAAAGGRDTAAAAGRDTATAPRPAPAPAATQPSKPAPAPAPKPEPKPAPSPEPAAAPEPVPSAQAPDTAQAQESVATAQDTAPARDTAQGGGAGETQTATAPLRDAYHQAPKDTVDQTTYDGWKQYNLNCARCHGEDVLGSTIAPHLVTSMKPDGPINTQEAFVQVVCAGRPEKGMPSWCALGMEPAKINQIYAYVKGRSEGKIGPGRPAVREGG